MTYLQALRRATIDLATNWRTVPEVWRDLRESRVEDAWHPLTTLLCRLLGPVLLPLAPLLAWLLVLDERKTSRDAERIQREIRERMFSLVQRAERRGGESRDA